MSKNIVICCDGTGNEFGPRNSNVVKLFQVLRREPLDQAAYYDPGVGTMGAPEALSKFAKWLTWRMGLAFGYGLTRNVCDAYAYLMEYYRPGDRVFLFGFSRGAYTVRTLAGMLHKVGLLERGADNQIPYAFRIFRQWTNFEVAAGFKKTFGRICPIHFVGVWDTVSTVGWIYNPVTFPFTAQNPSIEVFRHAISIDERRTHFRTNLFHPDSKQDCKQVWFAGVHSDVGGSYPEPESGLSKITLQWMLREAKEHELLIDAAKFDQIVLGMAPSKYAAPDAGAMPHDELRKLGWRLIEHLPRRYIDVHADPPAARWSWSPFAGFYRPRPMAENSCVHQSVLDRKKVVASYQPVNLPRAYTLEA